MLRYVEVMVRALPKMFVNAWMDGQVLHAQLLHAMEQVQMIQQFVEDTDFAQHKIHVVVLVDMEEADVISLIAKVFHPPVFTFAEGEAIA